ncbi:SNF2 family helicase [Nitzschia inconspicua]|uniref:SNF2 family helicase n=1 Tax=Nitzschia inconspicua TaxID=303405 RepID=A0A9K3KA00_9STRA|nr:SNF2 family helicase [Nitzschia inconspicua]KAG7340415.1 SNF2 family helicase [Nitzschia inconspicua]
MPKKKQQKRNKPVAWASIGTRVNKFFEGYEQYYGGQVESFDPSSGFYLIKYDDGDSEEVDEEELQTIVVQVVSDANNTITATTTSDSCSDSPSSMTSSRKDHAKDTKQPDFVISSRGRRRNRVSYVEDFLDDDESEDRRPASRPTKKQRRCPTVDDDDEEEEDDHDDDEASLADSAEEEDEDMEGELGSEDDFPPKKTSNRSRGSKMRKDGREKLTKASNMKTKAKDRDDGNGDEEGDGNDRLSMAESFKPLSTPLFWNMSLEEIKQKHEYLDPCGMEATDDVIDHLVGEQVLKIGKLLERALTEDNSVNGTLGSEKRPLNLGTACSGTDAPALALTIVQEQMDRYGMKAKLHYDHKFSCEKEPFKQAYLAMNFSSVLFPDIVKLTDENPRDVYGRIQPVPKSNTFVAGTSCKNFSLLHSTKRLDIEDKGCSGETFLAAVEFLLKEQPDFAIFENVIGAPWEKMQEYVSGRVALKTVNQKKKAIQATRKEDEQTKELTFELQTNGDIMVTAVPLQVGVRCGAIVAGFLKGSNLSPATWPKTGKRTCTLGELIKAGKADSKSGHLVFKMPCTYCTSIAKVDTKNYGLPQTRMRTYMFVWKADKHGDYDDNLGIYWQAIVKHLESPVKHSLEAFILNPDHDNIRVFREALRGPPGRHTKRSIFQEPDFYTSGNANVRHNTIAREKSGMDLTRATTHSGAFGKKQVPPHYWLEYLDCQPQRQLDMIDILHASAARDAESHDSHHSSFFWNISQNVSKEKHRTAVPGIAGCISPGGEFFVTNLGRPLLGCEKLLLQGIPYFRLLLGNETEVQLGDLAGNAMSLTVVCATLLAAVGCRQLRKEHPKAKDAKYMKEIIKFLETEAGSDHSSKGVVIPKCNPDFSDVKDAGTAFYTMASLGFEAVQSSVWCTCETSGRNSDATHFLCCSVCRVSCCASCLGSHTGYQMDTHTSVDTKLTREQHNLGNFLTKLRDVAPASLVFSQESMSFLANLKYGNHHKTSHMPSDVHRVKELHKFSFHLQKIQRQRRKWVLYYNARDNNGVGEVVASFVITVGEIATEAKTCDKPPRIGLRGDLISYLPAKMAPLVSGTMQPCAVLILEQGSKHHVWRALDADSMVSLRILGTSPEPSFRVELGLLEQACQQLHDNAFKGSQAKYFKKSQKIGEERRWVYAENWKEWPGVLSLSCKDYPFVDGTYRRVGCRQTLNQSALWVRTGQENALYIIIKPNVGRTGPDVALVSSSMSPDDFSEVILTLPSSWQPCDALQMPEKILTARRANWIDAPVIQCHVAALTATIESTVDLPDFLTLQGLSQAQVNMLYPFTAKESTIRLSVHGGVESQKIIRSFNYLCVPSILRHAAKSAILSHLLSPEADWITLAKKEGDPQFGFCEETLPPRPAENWVHDDERETWVRSSSPEDSREFHRRLQQAPTTFEFLLDKLQGALYIRCYPQVAAHHAAYFLLGGRGMPMDDGKLKVQYRIADATLQSDPSYTPFKVFPCTSEDPTLIPLKAPYTLYERQQKVVTKMSLIESGKISFEEIEMVQHDMPGSTGFTLIAKASRQRQITGGVIADAIGAGKTVVSIAMILQGLEKARTSRCIPRKSGATLVAVPSGLINQWNSEIDKFTTGLNVLCIHDLSKLKNTSVKQIVEADVVVAPVDIVESKAYTENLSNKSGQPVPEIPKDIGQKERAGVRGVWIPASSRDPFGMGATTEMKNQRKREHSAFFTFTYLQAIESIRQQNFKPTDKGIPIEYFEWERVIVDEIHECLMAEKDYLELDWFKEKNRRASRELLGIAQKSVSKRPLVFRRAIFGLTGTPLLDNSDRVIELANLIGCTYIIGLASHWRKLERESRRDIFLQQFLEPRQSREIRKAIYSKCQQYLKVACCRNTTEKELEGIEKVEQTVQFQMTAEEKDAYIASQHGLDKSARGLGVRPENFDPTAGHDISKFLKQNASSPSRGKALVATVRSILEKDPTTKILVFADGRIGAGHMVQEYLEESGLGCTCLDSSYGADVELQNELISCYQRADVTEEDKARPRTLVLHFEHAAGLNLQSECFNLILYTPLYVGDGGITGDPVFDASTEQQAIGRVYRPGQMRPEVYVHRLEMQGPNGEECLDGYLIRRNTMKATLDATTNAAEEIDECRDE